MVLLNNYDYDVLACLAIDLGIGAPTYTTTRKKLVEDLSRVIAIEKREIKSGNEAILYDKRIKRLLREHKEFLKSSTKERENYWKFRFKEIQDAKNDGFTVVKGEGLFRTLAKEAPILFYGEPLLNGSQTPIQDRFRPFAELDTELSDRATRQNNITRSPRISNPAPLQTFQDIEGALSSSARLINSEPAQPVPGPHEELPPSDYVAHFMGEQGIIIDNQSGVIMTQNGDVANTERDTVSVITAEVPPRIRRGNPRNSDQFEFVDPETLLSTNPLQEQTGSVFITSTGGEIPLDDIDDYGNEDIVMEVDYEDPDYEDEMEIEEIERINRERRTPVNPPEMVPFNEVPNNTAIPVNPFRTFEEVMNGNTPA
jgi:hypothetical protein